MRRTRAAVERRKHPSIRAAVEEARRLALSALPSGVPATVEVRGDGNGRIEARAAELEEGAGG